MSEEQTDDYIVNGDPEDEAQPETEEVVDAGDDTSAEVSEETDQPEDAGEAGEDSEPEQVAETSFEDQLKAAREEAFREGEAQKQKEMVGAIASMRERFRRMDAGQTQDEDEEDYKNLDDYLDEVQGIKPQQPVEQQPVEHKLSPEEAKEKVGAAYDRTINPAFQRMAKEDQEKLYPVGNPINGGASTLDRLAQALVHIGSVIDPSQHLLWIANNHQQARDISEMSFDRQVEWLRKAVEQQPKPQPAPQQRVRPTGGVNTGGGGSSVATGNGQRWGL